MLSEVVAPLCLGDPMRPFGCFGARSAVIALLSGRGVMATLTIRQLDERTHARLRGRAADNHRSVEAEVRAIIDAAVNLPAQNMLMALHDSLVPVGGVNLDLPDRSDAPRAAELP